MIYKKEVTIYDIARELKCAPSTVSRALNDHKSISEKTREQVLETARRMGYRPNNLAAGLRRNKSKTIGILISRINRPFISSVISGIEETARESGYNVLISQSNDKYENEVSNSKALYDSRISGLVVSLAMETQDVGHFARFIEKGIPIVFVDRVPQEFNSYKVVIDNYKAGYDATSHLIEQGCRRIAHFGGAQHRNIYKDRRQGYMDALKEHSLPIAEDLILALNILSFEEGLKATAALLDLDEPPDGIFSANDTAAVSAIVCAKQRGLKVPEDLAVIGFNDDFIASIIDPPMSTVSHPAHQMGQISAKRILEHSLQTYDANTTEITVLNTEVIVRASSLRIGKTEFAG
jgi:LacI family transcriptional regulator